MPGTEFLTTVWDWAGKLGIGGLIGGIVGWFIRRWFEARDEAVKRGRQLVGEGRPELVPEGGRLSQHGGSFAIRNRGRGVARDIRVHFTGSPAVARAREIEPETRVHSEDASFADSPFFQRPQREPFHLTVKYADRFGNEYEVTVPVRQVQRADGGFNMRIDWEGRRYVEPRLSRKRLREIGA